MKNILILGGSSDIAFELIPKLLNRGCKVTAHYSKNSKRLNSLMKKNKNLKIFKKDFSNLSNSNLNRFLKIKEVSNNDTIINLIGFMDNKTFNNTSMDQTINSLKINMLIPIFIIRKNLGYMTKINYGRILNCTSIGIKFGGGDFSYNYNLSKHSLEFVPKYLKILSKKNILVNNLRIGYTNTKIHKRMKKNLKGKNRINLIPMKRAANPLEIVEYILNLISKRNSYMTGETITVAGGE